MVNLTIIYSDYHIWNIINIHKMKNTYKNWLIILYKKMCIVVVLT